MKVLLILPVPPRSHFPQGAFESRWVPTGLSYIASALLRAGCEVRVHVREEQLIKSRHNWERTDELLRAELTSFAPDLVGLSVFTPSVPETREVAELAKRLCGDSTVVVAGGVHPSALPERTLEECPALDAVVVGEGERTMVELAARGIREEVAGLVWRDGNGGFRRSPPRAVEHDLDALGGPAYALFDMEFWAAENRWMVRWLPLRATNFHASRGCTSRCQFCAGHVVAGLGLRFHSVEHVVEQIARVAKDYRIEGFRFEDDSLGADTGFLRAICAGLRKEGLHRLQWDCCMRVDQADLDLLREMRASGCVQIEYGFESGSDAALKKLGKGASVAQNRRAVELMRQAGLRVFANIMMGLPGETAADVDATEAFVYWAKPDVLSFGCLMPLPGTPLFEHLPQPARDSLKWADYAYFNTPNWGMNLTGMSDEELVSRYRRFEEHLAIPHTVLALRRDTPLAARRARRHLRRMFLSFAARHPLRAARLLV